MIKKILIVVGVGLVILLIVAQFIPVNRSNPPVTQEINWDSPTTKTLAQRACYDCHSNETVWPWYSYIAPVSWFIAHHVEEGRAELNFSEWDRPQQDKKKKNKDKDETEEIVKVIKKGRMPLRSYLITHSEAKLSQSEIANFITGIEQTLQNDPPQE